jgi:hypothetical protein
MFVGIIIRYKGLPNFDEIIGPSAKLILNGFFGGTGGVLSNLFGTAKTMISGKGTPNTMLLSKKRRVVRVLGSPQQ